MPGSDLTRSTRLTGYRGMDWLIIRGVVNPWDRYFALGGWRLSSMGQLPLPGL
jgi:hypothetical protein